MFIDSNRFITTNYILFRVSTKRFACTSAHAFSFAEIQIVRFAEKLVTVSKKKQNVWAGSRSTKDNEKQASTGQQSSSFLKHTVKERTQQSSFFIIFGAQSMLPFKTSGKKPASITKRNETWPTGTFFSCYYKTHYNNEYSS